ncbi:MAG: hypothetical protein HFE85_05000 [Clostridiales bacterium]|nr:hypothetical protein [Clostridiales bacterium]
MFWRRPASAITAHLKQEFGIWYLDVTCDVEKDQAVPWEQLRRAAVGADSAVLPSGTTPDAVFDLRSPLEQRMEEQCMQTLFLEAAKRLRRRRSRALLCDPGAQMTELCRAVLPFCASVSVYTHTPEAYEGLQQQALYEWGAPLVLAERMPELCTEDLVASFSSEHLPAYRTPGSWTFTCGTPAQPVQCPEKVICACLPYMPQELVNAFPAYSPKALLQIFARGNLYGQIFRPNSMTCLTADGREHGFSTLFPDSTQNSP